MLNQSCDAKKLFLFAQISQANRVPCLVRVTPYTGKVVPFVETQVINSVDLENMVDWSKQFDWSSF